MSDFQYVARAAGGKQVTGVLSAGSEQEALSVLAGKALFPMRLRLAPEAVAQRKKRTRRVRPKHLAIAFSQLSDLLRSGVPLLRSLELLEHKAANSNLKAVLEVVRQDVAEGTRLAEAMGYKKDLVVSQNAERPGRAPRGRCHFLVPSRIEKFSRVPVPTCAQAVGQAVSPVSLK